MARSKVFLRTRDVDWALDIGGRYIHVASAGGDLPTIVEDRLFDIWRELKDAPIVCLERDVILNEQYLKEKFANVADEGPIAGALREEWYVHSFKAMAMRGFYSFDRDIRSPFDDSVYHLVAKPGNMSQAVHYNLPVVNLRIEVEQLDGRDIVRLINEVNIR